MNLKVGLALCENECEMETKKKIICKVFEKVSDEDDEEKFNKKIGYYISELMKSEKPGIKSGKFFDVVENIKDNYRKEFQQNFSYDTLFNSNLHFIFMEKQVTKIPNDVIEKLCEEFCNNGISIDVKDINSEIDKLKGEIEGQQKEIEEAIKKLTDEEQNKIREQNAKIKDLNNKIKSLKKSVKALEK